MRQELSLCLSCDDSDYGQDCEYWRVCRSDDADPTTTVFKPAPKRPYAPVCSSTELVTAPVASAVAIDEHAVVGGGRPQTRCRLAVDEHQRRCRRLGCRVVIYDETRGRRLHDDGSSGETPPAAWTDSGSDARSCLMCKTGGTADDTASTNTAKGRLETKNDAEMSTKVHNRPRHHRRHSTPRCILHSRHHRHEGQAADCPPDVSSRSQSGKSLLIGQRVDICRRYLPCLRVFRIL